MSECNCCCGQYSTPPWWVTMGFVPPTNNAGQRPTLIQQPAQPVPPTGQTHTGTMPNPLNPIGQLIGGLTGGGGQTSSGGGGLLQTVGNVVGDVLNPLGGLLNLL